MANLFSDLLTTRDALSGISDPGTYAGQLLVTRAFFTVASNPADNDVIMMLDVPSNAKPSSLILFSDDMGASSVSDFGIYAGEKFTDTDAPKTEYSKNQVINVNAFDDASGILNSPNHDVHIELRFQLAGSSASLDRIDDAMWQLADLDSDPLVNMRIGIALPTNWTTFVAGNIVLISEYTVK